MIKLATYEMILSEHPLWSKEANALATLAGVGAGAGFGAGAGYLTAGEGEDAKRRALAGAGIGAIGGGLGVAASHIMNRPRLGKIPVPKRGEGQSNKIYERIQTAEKLRRSPDFAIAEGYSPEVAEALQKQEATLRRYAYV